MKERTLAEELGRDLVGKATIWSPAIAGGLALGPVGFLLGLAAGVAIVVSGGNETPPVAGENEADICE